ncbi:hypothetical protein PFISCL1PPCAC_4637, partial [Pristionchus fissidentatus]
RSILVIALLGAAIVYAQEDDDQRRRARVVHTPPQTVLALDKIIGSAELNPLEKNAENAKVVRPRHKAHKSANVTTTDLPEVNFPESAEKFADEGAETPIEDTVVEANTEKANTEPEKDEVNSELEKLRHKKQLTLDELHVAEFFNGEEKE